MGPEESMQIQSNLASTIAMAFDECPSSVAERSYVEASVARTTRWLERCKIEMKRLNSLEDTINKNQMLFGINQGAIFEDIRIDHAKRIAEMDLDGYANYYMIQAQEERDHALLFLKYMQSNGLKVTLEAFGHDHKEQILSAMRAAGYDAKVVLTPEIYT